MEEEDANVRLRTHSAGHHRHGSRRREMYEEPGSRPPQPEVSEETLGAVDEVSRGGDIGNQGQGKVSLDLQATMSPAGDSKKRYKKLFGAKISECPLTVVPDLGSVPKFLLSAFDYIEQFKIKSEGIFRASPSLSELKKVVKALDSDPSRKVDSFENMTQIMAAALIKMFLKSIPGTLLTDRYSRLFLCAFYLPREERIEMILQLCLCLPGLHFNTLKILLEKLHVISLHPETLMTHHNLAVVIGPNLMPQKSVIAEEKGAQIATHYTLNTRILLDNFRLVGNLLYNGRTFKERYPMPVAKYNFMAQINQNALSICSSDAPEENSTCLSGNDLLKIKSSSNVTDTRTRDSYVTDDVVQYNNPIRSLRKIQKEVNRTLNDIEHQRSIAHETKKGDMRFSNLRHERNITNNSSVLPNRNEKDAQIEMKKSWEDVIKMMMMDDDEVNHKNEFQRILNAWNCLGDDRNKNDITPGDQEAKEVLCNLEKSPSPFLQCHGNDQLNERSNYRVETENAVKEFFHTNNSCVEDNSIVTINGNENLSKFVKEAVECKYERRISNLIRKESVNSKISLSLRTRTSSVSLTRSCRLSESSLDLKLMGKGRRLSHAAGRGEVRLDDDQHPGDSGNREPSTGLGRIFSFKFLNKESSSQKDTKCLSKVSSSCTNLHLNESQALNHKPKVNSTPSIHERPPMDGGPNISDIENMDSLPLLTSSAGCRGSVPPPMIKPSLLTNFNMSLLKHGRLRAQKLKDSRPLPGSWNICS